MLLPTCSVARDNLPRDQELMKDPLDQTDVDHHLGIRVCFCATTKRKVGTEMMLSADEGCIDWTGRAGEVLVGVPDHQASDGGQWLPGTAAYIQGSSWRSRSSGESTSV